MYVWRLLIIFIVFGCCVFAGKIIPDFDDKNDDEENGQIDKNDEPQDLDKEAQQDRMSRSYWFRIMDDPLTKESLKKSCYSMSGKNKTLNGFYGSLDVMSRLGKVAAYLRIFRRHMQAPNGMDGFNYLFPDFPFDLDTKIMESCTKHIWVGFEKLNEEYYQFQGVHEPIDTLTGFEPFQCADESFCPDPCCGRWEKRNVTCSNDKCQVSSNQTETAMRDCVVLPGLNTDFSSIASNNWNITCSCEKESFEYDVDLDLCIDIDECLNSNAKCRRNEVCVNKIGGFSCLCKPGFVKDKKGKCVNINPKKMTWYSHNFSTFALSTY
uniref:EGF-like domain-containing protein n=1 Tax=Rhabditophanes sp. KR3021 TaxID=114890 RepID=A0AC35TU73_9BILA